MMAFEILASGAKKEFVLRQVEAKREKERDLFTLALCQNGEC